MVYAMLGGGGGGGACHPHVTLTSKSSGHIAHYQIIFLIVYNALKSQLLYTLAQLSW